MVEEDCMRSRGLGGLAMRRGIYDYERLVEWRRARVCTGA